MTDDTLVLRSPGRAERTRRALAAAALNRLRADGSFTTEEVAADAGVSLATVYNRFPEGRDGLMAAAFDAVLDRVVEVTGLLGVERLLEDGLEQVATDLLEGLVTVFEEESRVMRAALAQLSESQTLRHAYRDHEAQTLVIITRFIRLGQAAGRIATGDPEEMAVAVLVLGQGLNNPALLGGTKRPQVMARLSDLLTLMLSPEQ